MMKLLKSIYQFLKNLIKKLNDPTRPLESEYGRLLIEARNLQRKGDIPAFARKVKEAEDIRKKIEELKQQK